MRMSRKAGLLRAGQPLSNLAVGSLVKFNETISGVTTAVPFRLITHGHFKDVYNNTNTTTFIRKYVFPSTFQWENYYETYLHNWWGDCDMKVWLGSTYWDYLDAIVKNLIITTAFSAGSYSGEFLSNGYSAKVFLLSGTEMGFADANMYVEGTAIPYYNSYLTRKQKLNDTTNVDAWLRSYAKPEPYERVFITSSIGVLTTKLRDSYQYFSPVFSLFDTTLVSLTTDEDGCYSLV